MASISLHQVTKTYGSGKQALQVGIIFHNKDTHFCPSFSLAREP
jgi:hypothetical protein